MYYERIEDLPELLPFKDDYIFKTLLTREGAEVVRNSMLSAFTGLEIEKSTIVENEPPMDISAEEKQIRLDVNCVTADGEKINIEMQARSMFGDNSENGHSNLCCRSIYYVSKLFIGQKVKYYNEMSRTFNIMVCDFAVFEDEKFIHRFHYRDGELTLNDITCIIYVELPKIKKAAEKSFPEMTPEERRAFLIEFADNEKYAAKVNEFTTREEFKVAMNMLSAVSNNELQRMEFISHQKYLTDLEHNRNHADRMLKKGLQEGRKLGEKIGEKRGVQKGRKEGIISTARKLSAAGFPIEEIAKLTGLSENELKTAL